MWRGEETTDSFAALRNDKPKVLQVLAEPCAFEFGGEGVQADIAEEVAAEAGLDGVQAADGGFDPGKVETIGKVLQLGADVYVADTIKGSALEEKNVFENAGQGSEKRGGL